MVFSLVVFTACGGKDKKDDNEKETTAGHIMEEETKGAEQSEKEGDGVTEGIKTESGAEGESGSPETNAGNQPDETNKPISETAKETKPAVTIPPSTRPGSSVIILPDDFL